MHEKRLRIPTDVHRGNRLKCKALRLIVWARYMRRLQRIDMDIAISSGRTVAAESSTGRSSCCVRRATHEGCKLNIKWTNIRDLKLGHWIYNSSLCHVLQRRYLQKTPRAVQKKFILLLLVRNLFYTFIQHYVTRLVCISCIKCTEHLKIMFFVYF